MRKRYRICIWGAGILELNQERIKSVRDRDFPRLFLCSPHLVTALGLLPSGLVGPYVEVTAKAEGEQALELLGPN